LIHLILLPAWLIFITSGCQPSVDTGAFGSVSDGSSSATSGTHGSPSIAVSSTYLAAAVRDLMGQWTALLVLAEPGMCPGHFDLRPSQVRQLHRCQMLARFEFQSSLDSRLADARLTIVPVSVPGGKCLPASYLAACRQLAGALVEQGHLERDESDRRLTAISQRMDNLSEWATGQIDEAGLSGVPVLSSGHQADFCRHLGLRVAGSFSAVDTATLSQIDRAVRAGQQAEVQLIVANLPEGRQLADALAARLAAGVVVLENFPAGSGQAAFDQLVRGNVSSLIAATRR
jgi:zinc transport system substrate-binding protein